MKKTNNKGFSLVELIIVVAIMAILIGVLAPQYLKYVEKSRVSADKDLVDSIYNACTTAASDADINDAPVSQSGITIDTSTSWGTEVLDTLGQSNGNITNVTAKFKSKTCKNGTMNVSADANGNFTVEVTASQYGSIKVPEN